MTVTLTYFARLRDLARRATETVELDAAVSDGTSLLAWLAAHKPDLADALAHPSVRIEINGVIGPRETPVRDGDAVGLLPPFSGG